MDELHDLTMSRPLLGSAVDVRVEHAAAATSGFFLTGFLADPPMSVGGSCTSCVDLLLPVVLAPFQPDKQGKWNTSFQVPNLVTLKGIVHPAQVVVGPTSMGPLGLDWSNGVHLNLDTR